MQIFGVDIEADSLIGPAVTAALIASIIAFVGYIGKRITDNRDKKRKKINAAEILLVEVQEAIGTLERFIPTFKRIAEERVKSSTHSFFIPVDDVLDKVLTLIEEQLVLLPHNIVSDVIKYYRFDRCLNKLLRELSHKEFAGVIQERKSEVVTHTITLSEGTLEAARSMRTTLSGYLEKAKQGRFLYWYSSIKSAWKHRCK